MPTLEDFSNFLAAIRQTNGNEAFVSDETGLVSVRVQDTYDLNLQFVESTGKILCFIAIAALPKDAPAAIYRDLLAGTLFGHETAGGHFALEADTGMVIFNYYYDFDKVAADPDGFLESLEKILQLCDIWSDRIKTALAGG